MRRSKTTDERRGMSKVGELLARYRARLRPPQGAVVEACCAAVHAELGLELSSSEVRYDPRSRTLFVRAHGALKSEIALEKGRVLARLRRELGAQHAPEAIV